MVMRDKKTIAVSLSLFVATLVSSALQILVVSRIDEG
jgi:hypothetical protein